MKTLGALFIAVSIFLAGTPAHANFRVEMNSSLEQLQAEVQAQLARNPDVNQMIAAAAGAGIHMPTLMRVLAAMPAVNLPNAVAAAVRAAPAQGTEIVGYAAMYGLSAQAPAIITAGIQAAPAQANPMLQIVLGVLFGKKALHQPVFQAAISAATDQLDSLVATGMRSAMRSDTEWVAVAAVRVSAPVNVVLSSALRTDPARGPAIITAVLRAGASSASVGTAAINAGVPFDRVAAAFTSAGVAVAGRIERLNILSGSNAQLGQTITLRLDGVGICGMQANWGDARPSMVSTSPNFWSVPFNINTPRTAGVYQFTVTGVANGTLPACQGSSGAAVTVISR